MALSLNQQVLAKAHIVVTEFQKSFLISKGCLQGYFAENNADIAPIYEKITSKIREKKILSQVFLTPLGSRLTASIVSEDARECCDFGIGSQSF